VLVERGWLRAEGLRPPDARLDEWLARVVELGGPCATDGLEWTGLLEPIFSYAAAEVLERRESQTVLARRGTREIIRELAKQVLAGGEVDSERFQRIIEALKLTVPYRGRAMFHPIRLALAGRAGEGELDRVILLLDPASKLDFVVRVKSVRQRMLEFCAALD
jgi:hypothetical protein